jgi:hypothetical protein
MGAHGAVGRAREKVARMTFNSGFGASLSAGRTTVDTFSLLERCQPGSKVTVVVMGFEDGRTWRSPLFHLGLPPGDAESASVHLQGPQIRRDETLLILSERFVWCDTWSIITHDYCCRTSLAEHSDQNPDGGSALD